MKCVVVGGGAAGMMASIAAADAGAQVILLEKNEKLGKKVYITGKGRCNVTNNCEAEAFFANVVHNSKFMYSSYYSFDNNMVMDLIEGEGCELKTERGDRVFPVSDHSSDILRALNRALDRRGVEVRLHTAVNDLLVRDGIVHGVKLSNGGKIEADRVIVATGGLSYPSTGSTGDGHRILKAYGHTVTDMCPGLVPLCTDENWCYSLQGLALKNVNLRLVDEDATSHKKSAGIIFEGFGEMLFTHFGISGPLVLSGSEYYVRGHRVTAHIDLKPALSEDQLDHRILRDFDENHNKSFRNAIGGLMPSGLIPVMVELTGIDGSKPVNEVTREERLKLTRTLKDLKLNITGTRDYNEAIITRGGVSVKEINPSTMESRLISGLYVCGELLDVDAMTGGFNLQIAWSTGHLAGSSAVEQE